MIFSEKVIIPSKSHTVSSLVASLHLVTVITLIFFMTYLMQVDQHICLGGMASCRHGDREGHSSGSVGGLGSALLFDGWVSSQPVGWHNLQKHTHSHTVTAETPAHKTLKAARVCDSDQWGHEGQFPD